MLMEDYLVDFKKLYPDTQDALYDSLTNLDEATIGNISIALGEGYPSCCLVGLNQKVGINCQYSTLILGVDHRVEFGA